MTFLLPINLGLAKLSRFELTHLTGIVVLQNRENGHDITYDDAEKQILDAESPLYLQRSYSDGSYAKFEILPKGMLKAIVA